MKNKILIGTTVFLILSAGFWIGAHLELYCYFYPAIDTRFSTGFTEEKLTRITVGMTTTEVENILGKPLHVIREDKNRDEWLFSDDGKCWWGDFAWLRRSVHFSNGVVFSIERSIRYD